MEKYCLNKLSGDPYFIDIYGSFDDPLTIYL